MYISTTSRITSDDELKYRNGNGSEFVGHTGIVSGLPHPCHIGWTKPAVQLTHAAGHGIPILRKTFSPRFQW